MDEPTLNFYRAQVAALERQAKAAETTATIIATATTTLATFNASLLDAWDRIATAMENGMPVRFISIEWAQTGNYILGLKSNGTVWKADATQAPLVWVQV